jgi:hypothetical protein
MADLFGIPLAGLDSNLIRANITARLKEVCRGVPSYLRVLERTFNDKHAQVAAMPTDYLVYAYSPKTREVALPGTNGSLSPEKLLARLFLCSADNVPDTLPLRPSGTAWRYVGTDGVEYGIHLIEPLKPVNDSAVMYYLDVAV